MPRDHGAMIVVDRRSAGVFVAGFATFLNIYPPQAILPALAATFGIDEAHTGLSITVTLLAVACVAPFVGTISDRYGRKTLMVSAMALLTVPTLLVATAQTFEALLAWRFAQGLLFPFVFAVTVAYVADECEGASAIRTAGTYSVGTIAGGFSGRLLAGIAADLGGWRAAFVALTLVCATAAILVGILLPRERRFVATGASLRSMARTYREHITNPRLLATCVIGFGMLFTQVAAFTFVNFYLAGPPFGLSPGELAGVFVVYLLGLVTTPIATRIAVRRGRRPTLVAALAIAACGLGLTLVPTVATVVAGLAGLCVGVFVAQALSLGYIGVAVRRAKSTAVGLYVTIFYIGGALGGIVPSVAWRMFGWPGVIALLLAALAMMALAGLLFWRDGPARPVPERSMSSGA